ncbi:CDP-alcohol phosphatidyltransferase family protein [Treponema pectinovorum]|uniref:CDP-alcohol phosphatidyltransferase family protein n=1 Tax=Treponema pectinovorum TaxID=164 RepID=UPI003D944994
MKVSNKFTFARLVFAPVFFVLYNLPIWINSKTLAFVSGCIMIPLLVIFELTDYWDGHYARKCNEVSDLGKLFDPFADVMLNLTVFVCAMTSFDSKMDSYMPFIVFILIMYREFSQNFLRMLAIRQGIAIAARKGGKVKTVFYIVSGFFMLTVESFIRLGLVELVKSNFGIDIESFYPQAKIVIQSLFVICLVLSYTSFIDYIKNFGSVFKDM